MSDLSSLMPPDSCSIGFPVWAGDASAFAKAMRARGVEVGHWWATLPNGATPGDYPVSHRATLQLALLPVHQDLSEEDLDYVIEAAAVKPPSPDLFIMTTCLSPQHTEPE